MAFFPQLVAGPIVRASKFLPQLREKIQEFETKGKIRQIILDNSNLKFGITLMVMGFFKKMFFADNIAPLVNEIFSNPYGLESFTIILGAIAFGFQIYGDFSGYTDIAIGAALILGFKLPVNFNKPYFAISPSDFWRRWHISLSSWLRDYLYIPLGGNKKSNTRTYANLTTVMFLGGLWHGASWNFVVWGLLHGVYLAVHKIIGDKFPVLKESEFLKSKSGKIVSIFVTQYFIFLAWIAFRVQDTDDILYSMKKFIFIDFNTDEILPIILQHKIPFSLIILFLVINYIIYKNPNFLSRVANMKLRYWTLSLILIFSSILFLYDGNSEDFIYFRF